MVASETTSGEYTRTPVQHSLQIAFSQIQLDMLDDRYKVISATLYACTVAAALRADAISSDVAPLLPDLYGPEAKVANEIIAVIKTWDSVPELEQLYSQCQQLYIAWTKPGGQKQFPECDLFRGTVSPLDVGPRS